MGIMGFLRDRMGKILAFVIGFALLAFIVGEVARSGRSFFSDDRNLLGEAAGEKIGYDKFQKQVDQQSQQFRQQSNQGLSPQILGYVQESAWNRLVAEAVLQKEVDKLGLTVGDEETGAMIHGSNPNQQIVQYFGDPKTGRVDQTKLNTFLSNLNASKADDPVRTQWHDFLDQLIQSKISEKYMSLVTNGLYVNSLEAKDAYDAKNKLANFKYATLDYSTVPDNKINITESDYQDYYDEHKASFKNAQETRTFDFVDFNASPSSEDSLAIKKQAEKLVPDFKASTNDSLFVQINAETKAPLTYQHKGRLEPKIDSIMFSAPIGFVYGPYLSNGSYKIAKLVDARTEPDSVKARHILIDASKVGPEKATATADSLKKLLESGAKTFADLASFYSIDKGSAAKGGELNYFARGAMVPVFENAAFSGKKGEYKIVTSQFGVHLIQIEDQKGSSKVAKVAIVDVPLKASSKTQTIVYSNAQRFLGSLTKDNFDEEVKKEHLVKKTATDIAGTAGAVVGIENAREIVRWAFNAQPGDFGDKVYISGTQYIVPHLVQIKPKGTLSLDLVKKQIEPMVKNKVKAKALISKFEGALNGASGIDQVAEKLGTKVNPIQNMVFANPVIPGASPEYTLIGTVFGSHPNKLSKPIEGQQGVFVFIIDNFVNPAPLTDIAREKQQVAQTLTQRADQQIFEALKDKANVKDYRAKFL